MKLSKKLLASVLALTVSGALFSSAIFAAEEKAPAQVLITNVDVFDGTTEKVGKGINVLIEGNLIKDISASAIQTGSDAIVIDGKGSTLMPGLIDMHQHLMLDLGVKGGETDWDPYTQGIGAYIGMHELLAQGITSVRDIAGGSQGIAKGVASGRFTGPRIYTSGAAISQTGGHGDWSSWNAKLGEEGFQEGLQNTYVVDGKAEISRAVRTNFRRGANFIKVFAGGGVASDYDPLELVGFTPEELKRAVDIATDYGSYVCVHAYTDVSYNRALDAGVKCFEHGFLITEKTVKRMSETEGVFWSAQAYMSIIAFKAPEEIPWFSAAQIAKGKAVNKGAINAFQLMKKYKIPTVFGSDMFAEQWPVAIENLFPALDIGYTPYDILKGSTSLPGKILIERSAKNPYEDGPLGVIQKGAYADILIVKGNPLEDLTILRDRNNLQLIMKDGDIFKNTLVPAGHEQFTPPPRTKLGQGSVMN